MVLEKKVELVKTGIAELDALLWGSIEYGANLFSGLRMGEVLHQFQRILTGTPVFIGSDDTLLKT